MGEVIGLSGHVMSRLIELIEENFGTHFALL